MYQCGRCRATFSHRPGICPKCGISFIGEERVDRLKPSFEEEARQREAVRGCFSWVLLVLLLAGVGWLGYHEFRFQYARSALRESALKGDLAGVQRHLACGFGHRRVDINELGMTCKSSLECYGMTALMAAARFGHKPVVLFLLDHGADPSIKSSDGFTAAELARKFGHTELAEMLDSRVRR